MPRLSKRVEILKYYLYQEGVSALTPKDAIKEAEEQNGQIWIDMPSDKNSSTYKYNIEKIDTALGKNIRYILSKTPAV